jgi:hypothetical protein
MAARVPESAPMHSHSRHNLTDHRTPGHTPQPRAPKRECVVVRFWRAAGDDARAVRSGDEAADVTFR